MSLNEVVIVSAARTPFGRFCGTLRETHTYELGAFIINEVLKRAGLAGDKVDEVIMGCAIHAENEDFVAPVVARQALLKAGLPPDTKSMTLDKACCSSMAATHLGYRAIQYGESRAVVVLGAENFSRAPFIVHPKVRLGQGPRLGHIQVRDPLIKLGYKDYNPVAVDAGIVALEHGVTREEQDQWALMSQQRYQEAKKRGVFTDEIAPIQARQGKETVLFSEDEFPKPHTTLEKLAKLGTVYGSPTVTAGNAPGLNEGASAMVLMSADYAREMNIEPLARIKAVGSRSDAPNNITIVPALVIQKMLAETGLGIDDVDLLEINEAFAAMPVTCARILAQAYGVDEQGIRDKLNVNGGAIAIGHPLGASGARIILTLMYELRRRGARRGISAICGGLAQGEGIMLETDPA